MKTSLGRRSRFAYLLALITLVIVSCTASPDAPTPIPSPLAARPEGPSTGASDRLAAVVIGGISFASELAQTRSERSRGLSNRDSLPAKTGMLFISDSSKRSSFWMKGMQFPLDFIWISINCTVADITKNVPPPTPGTPTSKMRSYRPSSPATHAFEINGGEADLRGIQIGDPVHFKGLPLSTRNACP